MTTALIFRSISFSPVHSDDNQIWLGSPQIAVALNYKRADRISEIYQRHADEFTPSMTRLMSIKTNGGMQEVRLFSLRGAHLLAMFARTPVAREFRRWTLDVLDKEVPGASPDVERRVRAFAMASEVATIAARTAFDAMMTGADLTKLDRWLVCLEYNATTRKFDNPYAKPIENEAFIATVPRLVEIIGDPGFMMTEAEMALLASACSQELARRLAA
jgi:prophage antirepressor-like protein